MTAKGDPGSVFPATGRRDVDGVLLAVPDASPARYVKHLSTEVLWHVYHFDDLLDLSGEWVADYEFDHGSKRIELRYRDGVVPQDLDTLVRWVDLASPMAAWRLTRLALDLARFLRDCHHSQVTLGVIHAERVAVTDRGFILMPTTAGVLPPIPDLPGNDVAGWLQHVAPEVLRTRASAVKLLFAGDVYGLGRLVTTLVCPGWKPDTSTATVDLVADLVEGLPEPSAVEWPEESDRLRRLSARMCARFGSERPGIEEVVTELEACLAELDPLTRIRKQIERGALSEAESTLSHLQESAAVDGGEFDPLELTILRADVALARQPPDLVTAIDQARKGLELDDEHPGLLRRLGDAYRLNVGHPQRLLYAIDAYHKAADAKGWEDGEARHRWLEALTEAGDTEEILKRTASMPLALRDGGIYALRARAQLHKGYTAYAWDECANGAACSVGADQALAIADEVAGQVDAKWLIHWMDSNSERQGIDALRLIAIKHCGELAMMFLARFNTGNDPEQGH